MTCPGSHSKWQNWDSNPGNQVWSLCPLEGSRMFLTHLPFQCYLLQSSSWPEEEEGSIIYLLKTLPQRLLS